MTKSDSGISRIENGLQDSFLYRRPCAHGRLLALVVSSALAAASLGCQSFPGRINDDRPQVARHAEPGIRTVNSEAHQNAKAPLRESTNLEQSLQRPDRIPEIDEDFKNYLTDLGDDTKGIANINNAAILGIAAGGAIGLRQDLDQRVRENTARHPKRWNGASKALGKLGDIETQAVGLAALYTYARFREDEELHDVSHSLFSAFTITGLSTLAVKGISNTDRPSEDWNNGRYGFPSYHAASSFALATVLDEHYGGDVGMPAYALAGLISWSRIDERAHDLSDIAFGAVMGYVIGKSVAGSHLHGDGRVRILPWKHPDGSANGLLFNVRY